MAKKTLLLILRPKTKEFDPDKIEKLAGDILKKNFRDTPLGAPNKFEPLELRYVDKRTLQVRIYEGEIIDGGLDYFSRADSGSSSQ